MNNNNATLLPTDKLATMFSGSIILPDDSTYEQARSTYGHAEGHPAIVLQPANVQDVAVAVTFIKNNSLTLSVRSGGHSVFSSNADGAVIDLSALDTVELIDESSRTVRIGAGATWGNVATVLQQHGLGISSGDTKSVGVGGLTLYGGIGWMVRGQGLALDNLVAAELVTADGDILHCSREENPDLFWALRGGGGNFGVVTAFEFTAHPIGRVYAGSISYTIDNLLGLLKAWRDCMRTADEALNTTLIIMPSFGPGMAPFARVMFCYAEDDEAAANRAIEPLLQVSAVTEREIIRKPYPDVLEEAHPPAGVIPVVKNMLVKELGDELLEILAEQYANPQGRMAMLRSVGAAMNRVAPDETAFAHRNVEAMVVAASFVTPDMSPEAIAESVKPWEKLVPFAAGAYANFFTEISDADLRLIYPDATLKRLAVIKKQYDPDNLFDQNCNIKPV